jgi:hypothetical protein
VGQGGRKPKKTPTTLHTTKSLVRFWFTLLYYFSVNAINTVTINTINTHSMSCSLDRFQ